MEIEYIFPIAIMSFIIGWFSSKVVYGIIRDKRNDTNEQKDDNKGNV